MAREHLLRSILLTSLGLGLAFAATGCEARYRPVGPIVTHAHPNGLMVRLPAAVEGGRVEESVLVGRDAGGFVVSLSPPMAALRWPTVASISLRPASAVPQGKPYRERTIRGRTIHFAEERQEGGSCSTETTLIGWERCGDRAVVYEHRTSECGGSSHFFWLVIEATEPSCGP